jgi:hypothetical protein
MFDPSITPRAFAALSAACILAACGDSNAARTASAAEPAEAASAASPAIALIGEPIGKHLDVPASARGPALPAGKAYRRRRWGAGCT